MTLQQAQEIVLKRFPDAMVQYHEASYEKGQLAPTHSALWAVYPSGGLGVQPLGEGPTSDEAWGNAASKVIEGQQ